MYKCNRPGCHKTAILRSSIKCYRCEDTATPVNPASDDSDSLTPLMISTAFSDSSPSSSEGFTGGGGSFDGGGSSSDFGSSSGSSSTD